VEKKNRAEPCGEAAKGACSVPSADMSKAEYVDLSGLRLDGRR